MSKNKSKKLESSKGSLSSSGVQEVIIPDEALTYIISNFLQEKNKGDSPVVIGVSSSTVETVLQLFIDWAAKNGYVKGGIMTIGGHKIG